MKYIDIFELSRAKTEEKGHLTIDDLPDLKEMLKSETPKADIHWKATGTGLRRRLASALLTIDAKLTTDCARCGKSLEIESSRKYRFSSRKLKTRPIACPLKKTAMTKSWWVPLSSMWLIGWKKNSFCRSIFFLHTKIVSRAPRAFRARMKKRFLSASIRLQVWPTS